MRRMKKVAAATLTAMMVASLAMGTTETWARSSKRAAWNNAAAESTDVEMEVKDACYTEDGKETDAHNVKSNVYANSTEWAEWKTKWESVRTNFCQIALTPGEDAAKLNAAWYSTTKDETPKIKLMDASGKEIKTYEGKQSVEADVETVKDGDKTYTLYPCKVTVTGLAENTSYKYQYYVNGAWSETYDYKTQSTDSFSVMYVGDPQIGASTNQLGNQNKQYYAMNDSYNWYHTLNNAVKKFPGLSFIMSAGDQINQTGVSNDADKLEQQIEYAGFLNPSVLRSLPVATTIGNHDSKSVNYSNHFNYPNKQTSDANTASKTTAGTDYYFTYGNTLFISIDTNNYNVATHENVIKEATEKNPSAKWRILMFHQDIYGSGYDHSDSDGIVLRTQLTPVIDKYDIDAVLQGHDHTYSRSYQVQDGNVIDYDLSKGSVNNPEGTLYITTGSGSGSKYYNLLNYTPYYIAERTNACLPSFSTIDFSSGTMTIKTYDYNGNKYADDFTITKTTDAQSAEEVIAAADALVNSTDVAYTDESMEALKSALASLKELKASGTTADDPMVSDITTNYGTANDDDKDGAKNRFKKGISTLLDKTIYTQVAEGKEENLSDYSTDKAPVVKGIDEAKKAVVSAINALQVKQTAPNGNQNGNADQSGNGAQDSTNQNGNGAQGGAGQQIAGNNAGGSGSQNVSTANTGASKSDSDGVKTSKSAKVKTGDVNHGGMYAALGVLGAAILATVLGMRKKGKFW